eukprot:m.39336 g.39336  ORF g.39336 m.39336 type:complete len:694 (-) comp9538_c0_seq2:554-2635(-)
MGLLDIFTKLRQLGLREFFVNEGPMYTFMLLYLSLNVVLFATTFLKYRADKWTWLRLSVHDGLPIARGAAQALNLNCAAILLPVCRNLVNAARGVFEGRRSIRRLFDKNILFHKWCAYLICFWAATHILAHFYNINNLVSEREYNSEADRVVGTETNAENVAFTSWPGVTGVFITVALILMVTTAVDQIRRSYFELFWYTHHLFVVFYVALIMHGVSGFVRFQSNFDQVPYTDNGKCEELTVTPKLGDTPTKCVLPTYLVQDGNGNPVFQDPNGNYTVKDETCQFCFNLEGNPDFPDDPNFNGYNCCPCLGCSEAVTPNGFARTWHWVIGPLALYLFERFYRFYMSQTRKLQVLKIVKHNDSTPVMEVRIQKVKTKAGQYAFLHCPKVSRLEWHPFTLTSCPALDYISFHIRLVGDWTCAFAEECGFYSDTPKNLKDLPLVAIDGPFGTSSEDLFRYETGICVSAGIGVTPFASLLQETFFRKFDPTCKNPLKTKRVYFYWICPGFDSWGWFANLLVEFEQRCIEAGDPDFLQIRIHVSRGWTEDDAQRLYLQDDDQGDSVIKDDKGRALKAKMNFGRPNWNLDFANFQKVHTGDVGVFFCGPKVISSALHVMSNKYTNGTTRFFYNKVNINCNDITIYSWSIYRKISKFILAAGGPGKNSEKFASRLLVIRFHSFLISVSKLACNSSTVPSF